METGSENLKVMIAGMAGWMWAVCAPVVPYAGVCGFLVLLSGLTGLMRMRRDGQKPGLRRLRRGVGKLVGQLTRVNVALLAAHLVQDVVLEGTGIPGMNLLKLTGGLICLREVMEILEHESTGPAAPIAKDLLERVRGLRKLYGGGGSKQ